MHTRIRIRTISRETKIIYALWICFVVFMCVYIGLIAGTMVYGVEAKVARTNIDVLERAAADYEAKILTNATALTIRDAQESGLVAVASSQTTNAGVMLGRAQ